MERTLSFLPERVFRRCATSVVFNLVVFSFEFLLYVIQMLTVKCTRLGNLQENDISEHSYSWTAISVMWLHRFHLIIL